MRFVEGTLVLVVHVDDDERAILNDWYTGPDKMQRLKAFESDEYLGVFFDSALAHSHYTWVTVGTDSPTLRQVPDDGQRYTYIPKLLHETILFGLYKRGYANFIRTSPENTGQAKGTEVR